MTAADDLLAHVISFLPTRDAVRTNVLSRRWRPLWQRTDTLSLDSRSYAAGGRHHPRFRSSGGLDAYQMKERLLSDAGAALRAAGRCPVTKLSLFVHGQGDQYCHDVMSASASTSSREGRGRDSYDLMVSLLAVQELRHIEELRLDFYAEKKQKSYVYVLDAALLPSNTLRVLDLAYSWIKLPRGGAATFLLPRLSVLRLRRCSSQMKDLEDLIRAAPSLSSLHIECHDCLFYHDNSGDRLTLRCPIASTVTLASPGLGTKKSIELDAPCLRTFKYEGDFLDFSMKSPTTELARVELAFTPRSRPYNEPGKPWFGPFWGFIHKFRYAKILKLKVPNIEGMAVDKDVQHDHLVTFDNLERLELEGPCDRDRRGDATVAVANLLRCCPVMNSLKIRIIDPKNNSGYRHCPEPLPDFGVSLDLFEGRYSKKITAMIDDSEVADLPGLTGCEFDCLRDHLKNVKLEFELKDMNAFEICLAKFFAENCLVLENLLIDDGKKNFLSHIHWMVDRWRADALEQRKQIERD